MSEDQKESEFKVVDKRRYSSDGEPLEKQASGKDRKVEKSKPKKEDKIKENKSQEASSNNAQGVDPGEINFASFFMSLAHQTLVLLGEAPHPETQIVSTHLEASKQSIDILSILEKKTKGNLTTDEETLVNEVLTSLRMAYLNKTKS